MAKYQNRIHQNGTGKITIIKLYRMQSVTKVLFLVNRVEIEYIQTNVAEAQYRTLIRIQITVIKITR